MTMIELERHLDSMNSRYEGVREHHRLMIRDEFVQLSKRIEDLEEEVDILKRDCAWQ